MATGEEAEVSSSTGPSITIGLAVSSSKSSKYAVKWALKNFVAGDGTRFMLIHVRQKVTLIPTPVGNHVPMDQVRDDIARGSIKKAKGQNRKFLLKFKKMCDEKVESEVLVVKGDNVADTISGVVSSHQISKLVVGVSSRGKIVRKSKGATTYYQICKNVPSFCTVYAVSKSGLSVAFPHGLEGNQSSKIFKVNENSNSGLHSDDKYSASDIKLSKSSRSSLSGENMDSSSFADHKRACSLHEYVTENKQRSIPFARGQITASTNSSFSDKTPALKDVLQEPMPKDNDFSRLKGYKSQVVKQEEADTTQAEKLQLEENQTEKRVLQDKDQTKINKPSLIPGSEKKSYNVASGLYNPEKWTCFLNSTLQCLTHTPPLIGKLEKTSHIDPCPRVFAGFCCYCALKQHAEKCVKLSGGKVYPETFVHHLKSISKDFEQRVRQDAQELLRCLLDKPDEASVAPRSLEESSTTEFGIATEVFGGRLLSQLYCLECNHQSPKSEPFLDLSLEINGVSNLVEALQSFTKLEVVEDTLCGGCKSRVVRTGIQYQRRRRRDQRRARSSQAISTAE